MTILTGCFRPSNKEIVDKFTDLITIFPTEDLSTLYDKETVNSSYLSDEDLGTWTISSYLNTKNGEDRKKVGILLSFNRNTKESKGDLIVKNIENEEEMENEYPIYYDKDGIHFVDNNVDESVKQELANFKLPYNYINLKREYIDNLKDTRVYYNGEVPLYGITYKLESDDININKIKEVYPELPIDTDNVVLDFEGNGTLWKQASYL